MQAHGYAEVAVNAAGGSLRPLTYAIPPNVDVAVGSLVQVPLGARSVQGIVLATMAETAVERVRSISGVVGGEPFLWPHQVELGLWLASYYMTTPFQALSLMLPVGVEQAAQVRVRRSGDATGRLSPEQTVILAALDGGPLGLDQLAERAGFDAAAAVGRLAARGLVVREWHVPPPRIQPRTERWVLLVAGATASPRAPAQVRALEVLAAEDGAVPAANLKARGVSDGVLRSLGERGAVYFEDRSMWRLPDTGGGVVAPEALALTHGQATALAMIETQASTGRGKPILLEGVTGSGKTEVYLQAAAACLERQCGVLVLVPEIALATQTVARFVARFGERVAVLHSGLSDGEQFDSWRRIRTGDADVVVGARGAVFSPLQRPGLIVIDEAHDWSYKQSEGGPRYDARSVAVQLGAATGAVVVEGTATPAVEAHFRARRGVYELVRLPTRVAAHGSAAVPALPTIEIVDLRQELRAGNRSMFSAQLAGRVEATLAAGNQALLYLNRRGTASYVQCRACGHVERCAACDLSMTWHSDRQSLICHQCNRRRAVPVSCPECDSRQIRQLGAGTERLLEETAERFPGARVARWDRDAVRAPAGHRRLLDRLVDRDVDIVVGTQMIAKGLDVPGVTLVGVLNADIGLQLPDFRAVERQYQLLVQVAGRAGRGAEAGHVVIQSYQPDHHAIRAVADGDYGRFFEQELAFRREHHFPPLLRLARLVFSHADTDVVLRETTRVKRGVQALLAGRPDLAVSGPVPCYFGKLRNRYRSQIVIRGPQPQGLILQLSLGIGWSVDIDPANLL